MCKEPDTRTPLRGCAAAYFLRIAIKPGISFSAISISFLPKSAKEISLTLYSNLESNVKFSIQICFKNYFTYNRTKLLKFKIKANFIAKKASICE